MEEEVRTRVMLPPKLLMAFVVIVHASWFPKGIDNAVVLLEIAKSGVEEDVEAMRSGTDTSRLETDTIEIKIT